jgi:Nuclease-related domain
MTVKAVATSRQLRSLFGFTFLPDSWRKRLQLVLADRYQPYLMVAFTVWLVALVETIQKTSRQQLDPRFWMLIAVVITAYTGARIFRRSATGPTAASARECAAADAMVHRMISSGLTIHHEENGSGRYVVVGPGGIYAMQVKARNVFGSGTIQLGLDNDLVLGGRISDSEPVKQAKAAAQELRSRLEHVLPQKSVVKPVVVFLNDWRINGGQSRQDVAVVNENQLQQYFAAHEAVFDSSDLAKISACLN